jgi:AcrR family transcriptional regulator
MPQERTRKTQQERSASTTERLLLATIDLLHDRGFHRMSTTDIAERAGVSRGALNHHFASKEEIVVSAIRHQLRASTARLHEMASTIRQRGGSTDEIVDFIWALMTDRLYYVTMEYLPEVRHNPDFKEKVLVVVKEFHQGLEAIWIEIAEQTGAGVARTSRTMNAAMCLVRGMIAQTIIKNDETYFRDLLDDCKRQVARELERVTPADAVAASGTAPASRLRRVGGRS